VPRKIKRRGSRSKGPGGMLQQLQGLQEDMMKAQEEIAEMSVTATAGGGAVEVTVTGERRIETIRIQPEVVDPDDVEMLQDLIIAAINNGLEQIDEASAEHLSEVTGGLSGLGLPGLG